MSEISALRLRLERLIEKTESAKKMNPAAWWEADKAGKQQVMDDVKSGRTHWADAHLCAAKALKALDADDVAEARSLAWIATDLYIHALEKRLRPGELNGTLAKSAKRRGRPKGSKNKNG